MMSREEKLFLKLLRIYLRAGRASNEPSHSQTEAGLVLILADATEMWSIPQTWCTGSCTVNTYQYLHLLNCHFRVFYCLGFFGLQRQDVCLQSKWIFWYMVVTVLLISGLRVQMEWVWGQEKRNKMMVLERYRLIFAENWSVPISIGTDCFYLTLHTFNRTSRSPSPRTVCNWFHPDASVRMYSSKHTPPFKRRLLLVVPKRTLYASIPVILCRIYMVDE